MSKIVEAITQLQVAAQTLNGALLSLASAVRCDDKTELDNAMALSQDAETIGKNPDQAQVVVFADLNRFKQINDRYGHSAGDAALSYAGTLIKTMFVDGCEARAYRRSGDEFVIVLDKQHLELFQAKCETFRDCTLLFQGNRLKFSMSFGLVSTDDGTADFPTLMDRAEVACLAAKSRGDGHWVEWNEELQEQSVDSIRSRCRTCNSTISCSVPRSKMPEGKQLIVCPICETRFSDDEP